MLRQEDNSTKREDPGAAWCRHLLREGEGVVQPCYHHRGYQIERRSTGLPLDGKERATSRLADRAMRLMEVRSKWL